MPSPDDSPDVSKTFLLRIELIGLDKIRSLSN